MSATFTQRLLERVIPTPVSQFLVRNFHPSLPLRRRVLATIPAGILMGMGIEVFMNATGFCTWNTIQDRSRRRRSLAQDSHGNRLSSSARFASSSITSLHLFAVAAVAAGVFSCSDEVLTRKEGERRAEAEWQEAEFKRKREERKREKLVQQQQQQ
jgi:hypothetical protein